MDETPTPRPEPPPPSTRRRVKRHSALVRLTHWLNAAAIILLLMTGLNIFGAHPRLYWGNAGSVDDARGLWLEVGVSGTRAAPRGWLEVAGQRLETTGLLGVSASPMGSPSIVAFPHWATLPAMRDLASARSLHFVAGWLLIVNGLVYLLHGLISGHIRGNLVPRAAELAPAHLWHDFVQHLKLNFPKGEAALRYEVLQKIAYAGIVLLAVPAIIFTGLAMSPGMDAAWGFLDALWGGRQSARSVHFIVAIAIAGFIAVHLLMVLLSGPIRQVGAMITGRLTIEEGR